MCFGLEHPPLVLRSDHRVAFFRHSPILSRLSSLRRYQSLVKVEEIAPTWCVTKDPSFLILSFDREAWHAHNRFCFSHHSSTSSSSEIPSSVISWGLLPLRGMCSLYHFAGVLTAAQGQSWPDSR
jgi:hypothetical protein